MGGLVTDTKSQADETSMVYTLDTVVLLHKASKTPKNE